MELFSEWLKRKELEETINQSDEFLLESPMQIENQSYSKITNIIKKYMEKYNITKDDFEYIGNNICESTAYTGPMGDMFSGYDFILYMVNDEILGGAVLKRILINDSHNTRHAHEELYISNFTKIKVKGLAYQLYSTFSKKYNTFIVSGMQQSKSNRAVWERWLRERENISEIFGWYYITKKFIDYKQISNFWCQSDKCQERRIVVKFK